MSTETPLNARQWLDQENYQVSPWIQRLCEQYACAVLAEAERALRQLATQRRINFGKKSEGRVLDEAADLLAGMRR